MTFINRHKHKLESGVSLELINAFEQVVPFLQDSWIKHITADSDYKLHSEETTTFLKKDLAISVWSSAAKKTWGRFESGYPVNSPDVMVGDQSVQNDFKNGKMVCMVSGTIKPSLEDTRMVHSWIWFKSVGMICLQHMYKTQLRHNIIYCMK